MAKKNVWEAECVLSIFTVYQDNNDGYFYWLLIYLYLKCIIKYKIKYVFIYSL